MSGIEDFRDDPARAAVAHQQARAALAEHEVKRLRALLAEAVEVLEDVTELSEMHSTIENMTVMKEIQTRPRAIIEKIKAGIDG